MKSTKSEGLNIERFLYDFMFQLTVEEFNSWKSQIVITNSEKMVLRQRPYTFTELSDKPRCKIGYFTEEQRKKRRRYLVKIIVQDN